MIRLILFDDSIHSIRSLLVGNNRMLTMGRHVMSLGQLLAFEASNIKYQLNDSDEMSRVEVKQTAKNEPLATSLQKFDKNTPLFQNCNLKT
jgi:cell division protein FtsB